MADIISTNNEELQVKLLYLLKKAEAALDIGNKAELFIEKKKNQLIGTDNALYHKMANHYTRTINLSRDLIAKFKSNNMSMQNVTDIYNLLGIIADDCAYINSFYYNPSWGAPLHERTSITRLLNIVQSIDENAVEIAELFDYSAPNIIIDFIRNAPINSFTICVIGNLIKNKSAESNMTENLKVMIESQKNRVLDCPDRINYMNIIRCGRPITGFMNLNELLEFSGSVALTNHIIIKRDVNYYSDMRGIFDQKYITKNALEIKEFIGVNKQVIKKYDTVRKLIPIESVYSASDCKTNCYLLEESNGWFRQLSGNTTKYDANNVMSTSMRPQIYNSLQSKEILSKCYDNYSIIIQQKYEDNKLNISATSIKTAIRNLIIDNLTPTNIKSFANLAAHINSNASVDIMLKVMNKLAKTSFQDIRLSHVAEFYEIGHKFKRELNTAMGLENEKMLGDMNEHELFSALKSIGDSVVGRALEEMDKNNLWTRDQTYHEFYLEDQNIRANG